MHMKRNFALTAMMICFAAFFPLADCAGEEQAVLREVVVTATRDREEVSRVPAHVSVITAEEIERSGAVTVADLLDKTAGVHMRTFSGNPSQAQVDLRGFGDNSFGRTLILLDGKRLNRPDMASLNWLQMPLQSIERIEIVRGAGTVLYGDAAIAGVINVITKRGEGKPKINASLIGGSWDLHNERVGVSGSSGKVSYAFSGENLQTSGYRDRSAFSSAGAGMNIAVALSDAVDASVGLSFSRTDFEMPGGLSKEEMDANRRQAKNPADESSDEYVNGQAGIDMDFGVLGRFNMDVLFGRKDINSTISSWSTFGAWRIDTTAFTPKYILERPVAGRDNKIMFGVDIYDERLDREGYADAEGTVKIAIAEVTKESLGFYLRDEFSILESLIVSAGYRTERARIKGKSTNLVSMTTDFASEKLHKGEAYEGGLAYLLDDRSKIFAKYARVFRYPFLDEQASYQGWGPSFTMELEAEKGNSYEAGVELEPLAGLKMGLTLFLIDMEDEIAYNPATWKNENLAETRHQGVEAYFSYRWGTAARFYGNYSYMDAEFSKGANEGKRIPLVPRHRANAGVEACLPGNITLKPEIQYVGKSYLGTDEDNSSEPLDAYAVINLSAFYRPEMNSFKLVVFLVLENLTGEKYATMGYEGYAGWAPNEYYPSPGFACKAGVSVEF